MKLHNDFRLFSILNVRWTRISKVFIHQFVQIFGQTTQANALVLLPDLSKTNRKWVSIEYDHVIYQWKVHRKEISKGWKKRSSSMSCSARNSSWALNCQKLLQSHDIMIYPPWNFLCPILTCPPFFIPEELVCQGTDLQIRSF